MSSKPSQAAARLTSAVVIATRNRPEPLRQCLESLNRQSLLPEQVAIVDSSDGEQTARMVENIRPTVSFPLLYLKTGIRSAARQRNLGAREVETDLVFFLDDDVVLEPDFVREVVRVFEDDAEGKVGGVSGTIINQTYSEIRGLNRALLGLCLGQWRGCFAGRLLGPAVNFLPIDRPDAVKPVEWLPSKCTCYRRAAFMKHLFGEEFDGYSFAEDVHLSARVRKTHQLLNTTRARLFHHDMGAGTHKDWVALGESMVRHRHLIMTEVLGRRRITDQIRLFLFEVIYGTAAALASGSNLRRTAQLMKGKLRAFWKLWRKPGMAT